MSYNRFPTNRSFPAPCIVDSGVVVSKRDMQRLLSDLSRVQYAYLEEDTTLSKGEGFILDVYADPCQSTLVANQTLYINVHSFDYLELTRSETGQCCFDLVQDQRRLKLIPLSNPIQDHANRDINTAALEAVVAEVLSANWDVCIDDDDNFSF
ncbi:MAG: hypothetical protein ACTS2F_13020 [Thainema sp.]